LNRFRRAARRRVRPTRSMILKAAVQPRINPNGTDPEMKLSHVHLNQRVKARNSFPSVFIRVHPWLKNKFYVGKIKS
jgi:hypothetical protein